TGRRMQVAAIEPVAEGIVRLTLEDPRGRALPRWTPGAHIDLQVGGYSRRYSLCGRRGDTARFEIAVLREPEGRGGSRYIHDELSPGSVVSVGGPKNHFRLDETADRYLLVAGGIGITPILAMADRLKELGRDYLLHYCGRARRTMAFLDRLQADHGD